MRTEVAAGLQPPALRPVEGLPPDPLLSGACRPLGIPPRFLAEALARAMTADGVDRLHASLIREYADAVGYTYDWDRLAEAHAGSYLFIWELLTLMQPQVRGVLAPVLPAGVVVTGCQGAGRRSPHALCSLLREDTSADGEVRAWIAGKLLPDVLPRVLAAIEGRLLLRMQELHGAADGRRRR
jgi:hypothetical protein